MERLLINSGHIKYSSYVDPKSGYRQKKYTCPTCGHVHEFFYALRTFCENTLCRQRFVDVLEFHDGKKDIQIKWYIGDSACSN